MCGDAGEFVPTSATGPRAGHSQQDGPLVLFDGVCNLCNASVRFAVRRDPPARVRFASLQSDVARRLLKDCPRDVWQQDSIVLIERGQCYMASDAVLRISRYLRWPWPILRGLLLVPRPVRDAAYRVIARHRYSWFGRSDVCQLPVPGERNRFLD